MRITKIQIGNFGRLHDVTFDFDEGLTVFCRENGWGKSTLAAFVKAMFYGLESTTKRSVAENERKHFLPWQGGMYGGSMDFIVGEKSYRVERTFGNTGSEDTFALYEANTARVSGDYTSALGEELFKVDKNAFENSCFFGQNDLNLAVNSSLSGKITHVENEADDMGNYDLAKKLLEEKKKGLRNARGGGNLSRWEEKNKTAKERLNQAYRLEGEYRKLTDSVRENEENYAREEKEIADIEKALTKLQTVETKKAQRQMHDNLKAKLDADRESVSRQEISLQGRKKELSEKELQNCGAQFLSLQSLGEKKMPKEKEEEIQDKAVKPSFAGRNLLILFAFLFAAFAVFLSAKNNILFGVIFLLLAVVTVIFAVTLTGKKKRQIRQMKKQQEEKKEKEKEREKQEELLRQKISQTLKIPFRFTAEDFFKACENYRRQNTEAENAQKDLERLQEAAKKSEDEYQSFCRQFSESELSEILAVTQEKSDADRLQEEKNRHKAYAQELLRELGQQKERRNAWEEEIEKIPELEEQQAHLDELLTQGEHEVKLLDQTLKYLDKAKEELSSRYLGTIKDKMTQYLNYLVPEENHELTVNEKLKVKINFCGSSKELEYYSAGWQQMVYFAQRLSIVDAFFEKEKPVLIFDDVFAELDDEKQKRAKTLLKRLSADWQIICFTCHSALYTGD